MADRTYNLLIPATKAIDNGDGTYSVSVAASTLVPSAVAKADIFNSALPAAENNWLGADIAPTKSPSYINIYVCISIIGVLRVARTRGGITVTENLNAGVNLVANAGHMFTIPWRIGDTINIRYSTTPGTITRLLIDEIGG